VKLLANVLSGKRQPTCEEVVAKQRDRILPTV
jgi:hypothetical protein